MSEEFDNDGPVVKDKEKQKEKQKLQEPPKYKVVILNDDFTPMDFVIVLVKSLFNKNDEEAKAITHEVHTKGKGIAGIYPKDIAETRVQQVNLTAQGHGHPLKAEIERE